MVTALASDFTLDHEASNFRIAEKLGSTCTATRDGGNNGYVVTVFDCGVHVLEEADIVPIDIHIDKPTHLTGIVHDTLLDARVVLLQVVEESGDGLATRVDFVAPLREFPERGWNANTCTHKTSR
jgi:hypothetical protein